MITALRIVVAALVIAPPLTAQQAEFGLWSAAELAKRDAALSTKVGADHSSRETLADYGHHRFRLLYRDAAELKLAQQHLNTAIDLDPSLADRITLDENPSPAPPASSSAKPSESASP